MVLFQQQALSTLPGNKFFKIETKLYAVQREIIIATAIAALKQAALRQMLKKRLCAG